MGKKKSRRKKVPTKKTKTKKTKRKVGKSTKKKTTVSIKKGMNKNEERRKRAKPVIEMLKRPEVRKLFIDVGGENAIEVVRLLTQYGEDEKIAEKLNVKVSDVRSVLNRFHNDGIVGYERTRDEETGWYYYNWKLNIEKLNNWVEKKINAKKEFVLAKIHEGEHYFCPRCKDINILMKFEDAADYNFKCPKCNTPMELLDEQTASRLIKNENSRD